MGTSPLREKQVVHRIFCFPHSNTAKLGASGGCALDKNQEIQRWRIIGQARSAGAQLFVGIFPANTAECFRGHTQHGS